MTGAVAAGATEVGGGDWSAVGWAMALAEFTAVEHFAHALASPPDVIVDDVNERTAAMGAAVDEVMRRYAPRPGMSEAGLARNLKIIDGLASMMSEKVEGLAANVETLVDPFWRAKAVEIHDDTVRQYWRLIALRSELDPQCRPTGEGLSTAEDLDAWVGRIAARVDAPS